MNWQIVYNKLSDDLVIAFNKFSASLKLTKSFRATVTEKISDKKYKVLYNKGDYLVQSDFPLAANDLVWVCVPNNNWDLLFVQSCDRVGKKIGSLNNYEFRADGIYLNDVKITK